MIKQLLSTLKRMGYTINTKTFQLNIIGVRATKNKPDQFDDHIHLLYSRQDGQWIINSFPATTDPGTYWLQNLMNPAGTAILKPGQYKNSHRIGVHRGKYQALVQQNPVTVIRDTNKDAVVDYNSTKEQTGIFGINIHRASVIGVTKYIGKHSAGCQVLANISDFNLLMQLAFRHKELYGNNFTYTLIQQSDMQNVVP